jgi:hypothetical protein
MGATNLSELMKSATLGEELPVSNREASRDDWRGRVGKEKRRNLRDPVDVEITTQGVG